MTDEEWRPVPGKEGEYEVSSWGRVKSLPRTVERVDGKPLPVRGRVLKAVTDSKGYLISTIQGPERRVHRLVCLAFHGEPPEGTDQVRHLDGDPSNNRPSNLRWGSAQDNAQDTLRLGRNWNANKETCPAGHKYPESSPGSARRCEECEDFRRNSGGHPTPEAHGKYSTYLNWYCRCDKCREAFNEYQRGYRRRKRDKLTDLRLREHGD